MSRRKSRMPWNCVCLAWLGLGLVAVGLGVSQATAQEPDVILRADDENTEYQELTRGPVHEAFAQPVVFNAEAGPVITQAPPEAVEEIPPDEKPEGDNVAWIPGYWSWDDDDSRFIWISGIWRLIPPGFEWVPGYWADAETEGYQWVSGFWKKSDTDDVDYLPSPPDSLENGPIGDPPTANHVWVPGSWMWNVSRYVWRPGYYMACRPGWIWVPAHYVWSPYGFIFVDGYWDYSIRRRGLLFAPVCFPGGYAVVHTRHYVPRTVIDIDLFTSHLFCRPRVTNYCFGDYYAPRYMNAGVYPWFAFHMSRYGYDPVYSYYRWHHSQTDRTWADHVRADYRFRRDHEEARPPHTLIETRHRFSQLNATSTTKNLILATSISEFTKRPTAPIKYEKLPPAKLDRIRVDAHRWTELQGKRKELELPPGFVRPGRPGPGKPDIARPDFGRPDFGRPDLGKPDLGKPDGGRPDAGKPDLGKPDIGRPGPGRPDLGRPGPGKPDAGKPDSGRPGRDEPGVEKPADRPDAKDIVGPRPGRPTPGSFGKDSDHGPRKVKLPPSLAKGAVSPLPGDLTPPPMPQQPRIDPRAEPRTEPRIDPRGRPTDRTPPGRPGPESSIDAPLPKNIDEAIRKRMSETFNRSPRERPTPVEPPKKNDSPPNVDPPRKTDSPRNVDPPRKFETPRKVDTPRRFDTPKNVEPPRNLDLPRKVDPPRKIDNPPRNTAPRNADPPKIERPKIDPPKIDRPKREPPARVDPPKIERPAPRNNPPRHNPPGNNPPRNNNDRDKPKKGGDK